ncbi:MAG: copper chaperone PCu(A)C [Fodinibius sp.]|nr:copper chaperone PCu(A)C [Fodinibius sp.]
MTSMKILLITVAAFFFFGCSSQSDQKQEKKDIILGKMELSDGWARPGSEGQNSAAYLRIANGTASSDTLLAIQSDAAAKAELHESYQDENNISGMRPIGPQIIAPATDLQLSPGGTHIMLINLQQDLAVGDTLAVSLEFARVGIKNLQVPVKIQE